MGKDKKSGFFGKLFGKNKAKSSCCSVEFEQVPEDETENDKKEMESSKQNQTPGSGCGCGCC
jgi:hypothetical protein